MTALGRERPCLRARLRAGEALIGSYVTLPSPEVVEVFAGAGMDYVVLDLQHSSPDWQTLTHMIRAAEARGTTALVRTWTSEPAVLLKLLEIGAEGLVVPGVRGPEDVRVIVEAVYYPPLGRRGACGHTRVGRYSSERAEFRDHVDRQNERVLIWALIEDPEAVMRAGEIAAVRPGAAVIGVGRGDLSVALGLPGQVDHPQVVTAAEAAIREVLAQSGGECVPSVMIGRTGDTGAWHRRGCRMFTFSADAVMLTAAARSAVAGFRSEIAGSKA